MAEEAQPATSATATTSLALPSQWVIGGSVIATLSLLLPALDITSTSHLVHDGVPRAEWLAAAIVSLLLWAVLRLPTLRHRYALDVSFACLVPLACMVGLLLEPLSLALHPLAFELAWFAPGATALETITEEVAIDLVGTGTSALLSLGVIATYLTHTQRSARHHLVQRWFWANLIAVGLLFLVPVEGPVTALLPLPPASIGVEATVMAYLPRLGFLSLPCLNATLCLIGLIRRGDRATRRLSIPSLVALVSAIAVFALELLTNRHTVLSAIVAAAVALAVDAAFTAFQPAVEPAKKDREPLVATTSASNRERGFTRKRTLLTAVFFLSGMAALVYQVVYAKGLALTFGSTSHASTIVLATYMGGLALGSWLGGRLAEKLQRPVLGYALAELGIAALCAASPLTLKLARFLYVATAGGADPQESWLVGLQLALGALVLVPPTVLMGLTMPLLTRQFLDDKSSLGASAGLLYTANTLGAAVGASVTGYAILPTLGVTYSLYAAVATNVLVSVFAILAAGLKLEQPTSTAAHPDEATAHEPKAQRSTPRLGLSTRQGKWLGIVALFQLTVGGFVTFGLETTFIHLLATVAGTSAYAFSLMLFAFLIGLSVGSSFSRKWLPAPTNLAVALLLCQFTLAVTLLVGTAYWDGLPDYFASFGRWPFTLTFAAREFVRFVVCVLVMVPPAICIGAQYPIAMEAVGLGWPNQRLPAMGRAAAMNTVGNILGAIVVGFVMLPRLGSHRTLAMMTLICLVLAALALVIIERQARAWCASLVAMGLAGLWLLPPNFDLTLLSSGGNVYFKPQYYGQVIESAESLDGGLTTVTLSHANEKTPVKTLLTNGKFQGNDRRDNSGEMLAQTSFAVAPLLHTDARDRALVIGFGTGTTTRVLDEAGFAHVHVAELSGDIITLADRHFSTINNHVIHRPNVQVHVTDGRNFLLLDRHQFDLVSIELSSIWFAGAANLYNDEFYQLVEQRLAPAGVLQQWVQLHRLSHRDILSILVTLQRRFPTAWVYFLGKQGIIVACKQHCEPRPATIARLLNEARLKNTLTVFPHGLRSVLYGRLLTPEGVKGVIDEYVRESGLSQQDLLSTDDNLYLEYSTPRGNVREYDESIADNEQFLARRRPLSPFEATQLSLESVPDSVE